MVSGYAVPPYSEDIRRDALFHYTTAGGLSGILSEGRIWSTAYFTTNDRSELRFGEGILTQLFRNHTATLINANHELVDIFWGRGVDIYHYADRMESQILGGSFSSLCVYITCFCKASCQDDFMNGLLSQWRGYGRQGGYALQFSRSKLEAWKDKVDYENEPHRRYSIDDVYYEKANPLKEQVLRHKDKFVDWYMRRLNHIAYDEWENLVNKGAFAGGAIERDPFDLASLVGGALEDLLYYLILTKNNHFTEERECRMSMLEPKRSSRTAVSFLEREGVLIPFIRTPGPRKAFLECLDSVLIGPGRNQETRYRSVCHLIGTKGLNVTVRPSQIPFVG